MIAVIGDIVHSRQAKNRGFLQQKLVNLLDLINRNYSGIIASKFGITLGDEFQGLVKKTDGLMQLMDELIFGLYPDRLRIGIGIGGMLTPVNPQISLGADGPAYWAARDAINTIRKSNDYGRVNIFVESERPTSSLGLVNEALAATAFIASNWRDTQVAVMRALLEEGIWSDKFEQKRIAEKMWISSVALSRRLASSGIKLYIRTRSEIERTMEELTHAA